MHKWMWKSDQINITYSKIQRGDEPISNIKMKSGQSFIKVYFTYDIIYIYSN